MSGEGGDDETAEGAVDLVGRCAEELGVGACDVLVGGFSVLDVAILPIGQTVGIGHLQFALFNRLREGVNNRFTILRDGSLIGIHNRISVSTTIASAHHDAFARRESATKMIERKRRFYVCHN